MARPRGKALYCGCGRKHPEPISGLCGICRSEAGLPTIDTFHANRDEMPAPKAKTVYPHPTFSDKELAR